MRPKFCGKNIRRISIGQVLWKTVGTIIIISSAVGIITTIWFGRQIKISLDDIGRNRDIRHELAARKEQLVDQRRRLMSREHIEAAAKKQGLYSRSAGQIRTP